MNKDFNNSTDMDINDIDSILAEFSGFAETPAETQEPAPVPEGPAAAGTEKTGEPHIQKRGAEKPARPAGAEARRIKRPERQTADAEREDACRPPRPRRGGLLACAAFTALCVLVFVWVLFNIHPASGTVTTASSSSSLNLSKKLDVYVNNAESDALGHLSYIKKIYTLQENSTVSPVPDPECFGSTTDPAVIQEVIRKAADLLDGQSVIFNPNAEFVPGEEMNYYLDDTILAITWKEYINQRCCTCAEVKIAHGSQLRRKLAEDSYSSSVQLYASDMAKQANAVVAINGDFYAFRDLGITAYQRTLYRNNPARVDSCFFTASGDMLFSRAGELGDEETQKFIDDNDVVFAIAFGPVLVDNGELQYCESYPIGEIDLEYSRSCIAMSGELHYFLMTINHTTDARPRATVNELARYVYAKGVQKAYNLDGGQTAEIIMNGAPINHVDFGYERPVSDIIYFATAIPDEEASK